MGTYCNYHPTRPAQWICPDCEVNYCSDCVDRRVREFYGKKKVHYFCPECNVAVERTAFEDTIVPFWKRLPSFFSYPFHHRPFALILGLSGVSVLLSWLPFWGFFVGMGVWVIILKYSFAALRNTANGNMQPPKAESDILFADFGIVFKQMLIYIIIGIAFFKVTQTTGAFIGLLFLCFAILSIPAMIIVLIGTESLLHAINPIVFAPMAWRVGWSYLLMYLFLVLLGGAPAVLGQFITGYLPALFEQFLSIAAESFYTLISYHLMGYVIYQYHEEIGYEVDLEDVELAPNEIPSEKDAAEKALSRADMLVREGRVDDAIILIKSETKGGISNLDLAERYYNLLKIKEKIPDQLEHGKVYLDLLMKTNQMDKICEVYSECISKNVGFKLTPSTVLKVASCLNQTGKPKESVDAYNRFIKGNPKDPSIPKAYFLASNIINEKLNNPRKAVTILNGLIKKYPEHEIIPHVKKYLGHIKIS